MIDYSDVESLIEECLTEMSDASREKYDAEKADRTAALFLKTQMKLSYLIEDIEMKSKNAKNEITRIEGEKYFEYKMQNDKIKITENMLSNHVNKDNDIVNAKIDCAKYESGLKKWNYLLGILKDGHIFFRNLSKNKNWSE